MSSSLPPIPNTAPHRTPIGPHPSPSGASGRFRSTQLISELAWLAMLELRLPMPERLPMTRGSSRMIFLEPGTLT